jgi:hypothetical protein
MIGAFIPIALEELVPRRTISLSQSVDELARASAQEGESFSATVARLIEQGARAERGAPRGPRYVATGVGPEDLGLMAERYLSDPVQTP